MGLTVACVLKPGGDYDASHVAKLHHGVGRNLRSQHRFVCLSDVDVPCERIPLQHDWTGWWSKLELFRPGAIAGDLLYFDLDTVIVGDLSDIAAVRSLTLLADLYRGDQLQSGVMYLPWFTRTKAWQAWLADPAGHMEHYRGAGDGAFLHDVYKGQAQTWQDAVPGQIVSYKVHVRKPVLTRHEHGNGTIPAGARVVCFHGRPRPHELPAGDPVLEHMS